jgi:hypothetical protein
MFEAVILLEGGGPSPPLYVERGVISVAHRGRERSDGRLTSLRSF